MRMKDELVKIVKTSSNIKRVYNKFGSVFIQFVGIFVPQDEKLILFNSFGGKKYDDSPKAIYEYMTNDVRFNNYKLVWAFHEPEQFKVPGATIIKTDNLKYFLTALKAHVWITNSGIERGLSFKKKNTICLNTWHGTPLKYMGSDVLGPERTKKIKYNFDIQNAQGEYEAEIFSRVFGIPREKMLVCGLPRNDILVHNDAETKNVYKEKLGISKEKKVVLYAPTFRDYERDEKRNCVLKPPIDFRKWKEYLGENYIVLLRGHYEVANILNVHIDSDFVRDVSEYPTLNDLMLASDMLISDYSSIIFDYSILERPILLYTYDYEEYAKRRGMYFDIRKWLPGGSISESELLKLIETADEEAIIQKIRAFKNKYVNEYGRATEKTVNKIEEMLKLNNI